jgi:hypothetical protein
MERGQNVQVIEFGGRKSVRRVVADHGQSVEVCNEGEWNAANRERRDPVGIGFPREYVLVEIDAEVRENGA